MKKKLIKNILLCIVCIVLAPILIVNLIIMVKALSSPDKVPGIFGYKPMIVMSASMEDTIMTNDLVFAKECNPDDLKVNDIISYRDNNNTIITHRIISINDDENRKFVTKGDNNNSEDSEYVMSNQIEGIYVRRIPKLGGFLNFIQTPIGITISLLSIAVICLLVIIISNKLSVESEENIKLRKEFEEFKKSKLGKNK